MNKGKLYIVPTPIGNLRDMTYRGVEILKQVTHIAAEDTRNSAILLKHYNIQTPMISYHKFNEKSRINALLKKLNSGEDIAIISDAGTPGISDPCKVIVDECIKKEINIIPLPGAAAFLTALSGSGFILDSFSFFGFIPKSKTKQINFLQKLIHRKETLVFYESPNRILSTLQNFKKIFKNRQVVIAKELTKIYEHFFRGTIEHVIGQFDESNLKGEFVIILEGAKETSLSDNQIKKLLEIK